MESLPGFILLILVVAVLLRLFDKSPPIEHTLSDDPSHALSSSTVRQRPLSITYTIDDAQRLTSLPGSLFDTWSATWL